MKTLFITFLLFFLSIQCFGKEGCRSKEKAAEVVGLAYDLADKYECSMEMDQTSCAGMAASLGFASTGLAASSTKVGSLLHKSVLTREIKKQVSEAEKGFKDRIANAFKRENSIREYRLRQNAYRQARSLWYKENLDRLLDPRKRAALRIELEAKAKGKGPSNKVLSSKALEYAEDQLKALDEFEKDGIKKEKGMVGPGRGYSHRRYDRSVKFQIPPEELNVSRRVKPRERAKIKKFLSKLLDEQIQDLKDSKLHEKVYRNPTKILDRIKFNAKDLGSKGKKYLDLMYNLGVDREMMNQIHRSAISGTERVHTMKLRLNKVKGNPRLSLRKLGAGTGLLGAGLALISVPQTGCSEESDQFKTLDSSCNPQYSFSDKVANYFNQPLNVIEGGDCDGMLSYLKAFSEKEFSPPKGQNSFCRGKNEFETELTGLGTEAKLKIAVNPETGLAQRVSYKTDVYEYDSEGKLQKICYLREQGKFSHMQVCRQRAEFGQMADFVASKVKERARRMSFHAPIMARCCQGSGNMPSECKQHYGFASDKNPFVDLRESVR